MTKKKLWCCGEVRVTLTDVDVSRQVEAIVNENLNLALASMEAEKMIHLDVDDDGQAHIFMTFGDGDWCDYNFSFPLRDIFDMSHFRGDDDEKALSAHMLAALDAFYANRR